MNILNDEIKEKAATDKTSKQLQSYWGYKCNTELCKATEVKKVPAVFLEWVIANYNEKLIPKTSLAAALKYVDLSPDDVDINDGMVDEEESFDDLLRRMD
jgi:hypothetical protein